MVANFQGSIESQLRAAGDVPLAITSGLNNLTADYGHPARLSVEVVGTPPFHFQWFHNDQAVVGATSASLEWAAVALADAGRYRVKVSDARSSTSSCEVTLTVTTTPPSILSTRLQLQANCGTPGQIHVVAAGSLPMAYTWLRNYEVLSDQTESEINFPALQLSDAGIYWARVVNPFGEAIGPLNLVSVSTDCQPPVPDAPVRISPPGGGWAHDLFVRLDCDLPGTVVRYTLDGTTPDATSSTYNGPFKLKTSTTVRAAAFMDGVQVGAISEARFLFNYPLPPEILVQPVDQVLRPGETLRLSVVARGHEPLTYQWTSGSQTSPGEGPVLELPNMTFARSGFYRVTVSDLTGSVVSRDAHVRVETPSPPLFPPVIDRGPVSLTRNRGSTAEFQVEASGSLPLFYQWFHNNQQIPGAVGRILTLGAVNVNDAGEYRVVVSNSVGAAYSEAAQLVVEPMPVQLPYFMQNLYSYQITYGSKTILSVQAAGTPPIRLQWYHDEAPMPGATSDRLEVQGLFENSGVYHVVASNAAGSVESRRMTLTVLVPTPPLETRGGTLHLANRVGSLDAPIFDWDGATRLEGNRYLAQLYGGPANSEVLKPLGGPVAFRSGLAAGYLMDAIVHAPEIAPGDPARVQVRAWKSSAGVTFEDAVRTRSPHGASEILVITTGNFGVPPTLPSYLAGLESFRLLNPTIAPPSIVRAPSSQRAALNSPVRLEVVLAGPEPFQFQWFKDGRPVADATHSTLELIPFELSDAGTYFLRVQNAGGTTDSPEAILTVWDPPESVDLIGPLSAVPGDTVEVRAEVSGDGPFVFEWFEGEPGDTTLRLPGDSSILVIQDVRRSMRIWARIRNEGGILMSSAFEFSLSLSTTEVTVLVFVDTNGNGHPEPDEPGAADVPVRLINRLSLEPRSLRTATNGTCTFRGVSEGANTVELVTPPDMVPTTLPTRTIVSPGHSPMDTIALGFQFVGTVSGTVFLDRDGDDSSDTDEPLLPRVPVRLWQGQESRITLTDDRGAFHFDQVRAENAVIEAPDPPGYVSAGPARRALVLTHHHAATAAFSKRQKGTISGVVFHDLNGNGQPDDEGGAIPGAIVTLRLAGGSDVLRSRTTGPTGFYAFSNLQPGEYLIESQPPAGFQTVPGTSPEAEPRRPVPEPIPATDSPSRTASRRVSLSADSAPGVSFAYDRTDQLTGTVFEDLDGDGFPGPAEPGISGARLELINTATGEAVSTTTSTPSGHYRFQNVDADHHLPRLNPFPGFQVTTRPTAPSTSEGQPRVMNFACRADRTIAGVVFADLNANGVRDPSEPGVSGVLMRTVDTGSNSQEWVSGEGGYFLATDAELGPRSLEVVVPAGFRPTTLPRLEFAADSEPSARTQFGLKAAGLERPDFVRHPEDLTLVEGASASISVLAESVLPIEHAWYKDGVILTVDSPGDTLPLTDVRDSDTGQYWAEARTAIGVAISRTATVQVRALDPYSAWATQEHLAPEDQNPASDLDDDGIPNLFEFIQGTSPTVRDPATFAQTTVRQIEGNPHLGFLVNRHQAARSVHLELEASTDLTRWEPATTIIRVVSTGESSDVVAVLDGATMPDANFRFLRLRVALPVP